MCTQADMNRSHSVTMNAHVTLVWPTMQADVGQCFSLPLTSALLENLEIKLPTILGVEENSTPSRWPFQSVKPAADADYLEDRAWTHLLKHPPSPRLITNSCQLSSQSNSTAYRLRWDRVTLYKEQRKNSENAPAHPYNCYCSKIQC